MNKQVEREITKIYNSVYKQVFNKVNVKSLANGDTSPIITKIAFYQNSLKYEEFAKKFSQELAKKGIGRERGLWRKYYQAAKSKHVVGLPYSYNAYEQNIMKNIIKHNYTMIKSIPQQMNKILEYKTVNDLIDEVANGKLPRGAFKKELDNHGIKNAKLIARTETAKLQSAITETRATEIGSVVYEWIASHDKRTRPSHKEMDGVIVFWRPDAQKPLRDNMRGNAGEFPNCRCYPAPILDESDLTKSNYSVYDYRKDEIVKNISKKKLLEWIKLKNIV